MGRKNSMNFWNRVKRSWNSLSINSRFTITASILFMFEGGVLDTLESYTNGFNNISDTFTEPDVFWLFVGIILTSILYSKFIEKKNLNLIGIAIVPFIVALGVILVSYTWIGDAWSGDAWSGVDWAFMEYVSMGVVAAYIINTILYLFNNIFILLAFGLYVYAESFYSYSDYKDVGFLVIFGILLSIQIVVVWSYMVKRYQLKGKKSRRNDLFGYLLKIALPSLIIASFIAVPLVNYLDNYVENQKREIKRLVKRNQEEMIPSERVSITPDMPVSIKLVGLYKAKEPIYLKYAVFDVEQYDSHLSVTPTSPNSFGSAYRSARLPGEKPYQYSYEDNSMNLNIPESSSAKVIFAKLPEQMLLGPEKVTSYDPGTLDLHDGFLISKNTSSSENQIVRYDFKYNSFNPSINYSSDYGDPYDHGQYVWISHYSERYYQLKRLTESITEGAETDYEKAIAIRDYFHENFEYTLNPGFTDMENPIDDFILDMKRGYCMQYAIATSYMLKLVNVESRVVGGYYSQEYDQTLGSYIIVSKQAHAWTEVYDEQWGWITIDSTPGSNPDGTGHATDLTEDEREKVLATIELRAADPQVSFDDVFDDYDNAAVIPTDPPKEIGKYDNDDDDNSIGNNIDSYDFSDLKEKIKGIVTLAIKVAKWGFILVGMGTLLLFGYKLWPSVRDIKIKLIRSQDRILRKKIIKLLKLDSNLMHVSSKMFIKSLPKKFRTKDVSNFYKEVDKLLYKPGEQIVWDDIQKLTELKSNIFRRITNY